MDNGNICTQITNDNVGKINFNKLISLHNFKHSSLHTKPFFITNNKKNSKTYKDEFRLWFI